MKRHHIVGIIITFCLTVCNFSVYAFPVLKITPDHIGHPTWVKPGEPLDSTVRLENIGDVELNIGNISILELNGQPG